MIQIDGDLGFHYILYLIANYSLLIINRVPGADPIGSIAPDPGTCYICGANP